MRPTPAYDLESTMDAMPYLERMVECMQETGFGVFSFDHEAATGSSIRLRLRAALEMADRITLFRLMARQVAKQCGLLATFMPKPYTSSWGPATTTT